MIFQEETKDKTGDSAKRTQLSHKKQQMAEKSGPSHALPRSPRPVSLYHAVTSGDDTSMPCPGGAPAKTDPRSFSLAKHGIAACIIRF